MNRGQNPRLETFPRYTYFVYCFCCGCACAVGLSSLCLSLSLVHHLSNFPLSCSSLCPAYLPLSLILSLPLFCSLILIFHIFPPLSISPYLCHSLSFPLSRDVSFPLSLLYVLSCVKSTSAGVRGARPCPLPRRSAPPFRRQAQVSAAGGVASH